MPPQTPAPSTLSSLDPEAVNLAKAIRQTESGGNFTAKGKSGEYGAYQFTEPTWNATATKFGVNVPLNQATPEQQNEVAYKQIKNWKDAGNNVGQIASMWNAGEAHKDAYLDSSYAGVNKAGASYNVPAYAKSVATAYQTLKNGGQVQADPNNPSSTANETPVQPSTPVAQPDTTVRPGEATALEHSDQNSQGTKLENVLEGIFPGTKQIGESLGTAAANIGKLIHGQNPDIPVNVPKTIGGYLQAGSTAASPAVGGAGALGRIGATAGLGALTGAGGALAGGSTSGKDIAKSGLIGGAVGGLAGSAGELLSKAAQYLPYSIVRKIIPGTNAETAQYAVNKGLGTPTSMLKASDSSLESLGSKIEAALTSPAVEGLKVGPQEIYSSVIAEHPNAGLTLDNVGDELKKLVPLQKGLVDKLQKEGLNPKELNQLKSALGVATYKSVFDEPAVKAGKQIGNTAYQAINDWLKSTLPAIRTDAPKVAPLFDDYTKELKLNGALGKLIRSNEKKKFVSLTDLSTLIGGSALLGPLGGAGALVAKKMIGNPSAELIGANLINKLNKPIVGGVARTGLLSGIGNASQGTK